MKMRQLGLMSATFLVIANMIGVGVFTTSGYALADLGQREAVLLAWLVGGLLAICGALSYGALARRIPESGGEYAFLYKTVHPIAGFVAGWVSLLVGFTAPVAAAGLALGAYLAQALEAYLQPKWIGTIAILTASLMHGVRLCPGVLLQNLAVGLKLLVLGGVLILGAGLVQGNTESISLNLGKTSLTAFAVTLVWISFSYSGWNATVYISGEVRDPERNLPRSLLLGTTLVMVIYLALNAVFLYSVPAKELAGRAEVGAIAAEALGGRSLRQVFSGVVSLALFTSISSMVMAGPRVYARMAEDGLFPRLFAVRGDTPTTAVVLQAGLAITVLWVSGLADLLSYIGFTLGLSSVATVGGLIALRHREGPKYVPIPGYPWVPLLFILCTLVISGFMALQKPIEAGIGLGTVAMGLPLYWLMRRGSNEKLDHSFARVRIKADKIVERTN